MLRSGILLISSFVIANNAEFTEHFNEFLVKKYGKEAQEMLERKDMGAGPWGSFGGKSSPNETIVKRPVIFVHGCMMRAVSFVKHREYFLKKGYTTAELYATTYGDGGATWISDVTITCDMFIQVRQFIDAVYSYTNSKVDIIANSMGSPVSRKAILGGKCHDIDVDLGPAITNKVDTFIATGGVNHGIQGCLRTTKACNDYSSMYCGSKLLEELNSQPVRFEGSNSYALYSLEDNVIGKECCGKPCGTLHNANASIEMKNHNHVTISSSTIERQFKLLNPGNME